MTKTTEPAALAVYVLLDQSGSMTPHKAKVIKAVNALAAQLNAANAPVLFSLGTFNHAVHQVIDGVPVYEMPKLTDATYDISGGTSLHSCIRISLGQLNKMNAHKKVLIVITDGESGGGAAECRANINEHIAQGYTVLWLGTGGSAIHAARELGFPRDRQFNFDSRDLAEQMAKAGIATLLAA